MVSRGNMELVWSLVRIVVYALGLLMASGGGYFAHEGELERETVTALTAPWQTQLEGKQMELDQARKHIWLLEGTLERCLGGRGE